jgi:hypothetical protein
MFFGLTLLAIQPLAAQTTPSLVGSWQLTFTPNSPPSATPPVAPTPGLATFTSDGSVIETDATEVVPVLITIGTAAYGTPGHGIWQPGPAAGNLYIQFVSLMVNQNATLHSRKTVTITGALDSTGDNFTGSYTYQFVNPTGTVIAVGSGVTGQKIPHPLLP